jgi:hypothetical protein
MLVYIVTLPGALNTRYGWAAAATVFQAQPAVDRRWQVGLVLIALPAFVLGAGVTESVVGAFIFVFDALLLASFLISLTLPGFTPMHNSPLYKRWVRERGETFARRNYLIILAGVTIIACSITWLLFLL